MVADYFFVIQNSKDMYLASNEGTNPTFYYTDNILECKRFLVKTQAEVCINSTLNDRNVRIKKVLVNVEDC